MTTKEELPKAEEEKRWSDVEVYDDGAQGQCGRTTTVRGVLTETWESDL